MHQWATLVGNEAYVPTNTNRVDRSALVEWFDSSRPEEQSVVPEQDASVLRIKKSSSRFQLEILRIALMDDLIGSIDSSYVGRAQKRKKAGGWWGKFRLSILGLAGLVVAICEGFDGISAILSLITAVPSAVIFVIGFAFSALSIAVFCAFDLVEVSKNMGVPLIKSGRLLDVFLEQAHQIKYLRQKIEKEYRTETNLDELRALLGMLQMLLKRYEAMDGPRKTYQTRLDHPALRTAKVITAAIAGFLFFGGGLSIGQTLSLAIAGLFVASISATAWPILATSIGVGLAAFSLYWFVERPGFENLVGRWFGLNKKSIKAFVNEEKVDRQKEKLKQLEMDISQKIAGIAVPQGLAQITVPAAVQVRRISTPPPPPSYSRSLRFLVSPTPAVAQTQTPLSSSVVPSVITQGFV